MEQRCILCGEATNPIVNTKTNHRYYRCTVCDLFFKDRSMILSHQQEQSRYKLHNNTIEDLGYYQFLFDFFNQYVYPFINNDQLGLDYGCGPNPVLCEIVRNDFTITMDYYDPYFFPHTISLLKQYDFITSTEVFEHFDEIKTEIEKVLKRLKPNGILSIMTLLHPEDDLAILRSHYIRDETHISIFGMRTIQYLCKLYNLTLLASDGSRNFTFKKQI